MTYYVDNGDPGASDSNPGTESQPWLTIQHAADTVVAGDTVIVKTGTGTYDERVETSTQDGTEQNPIIFKAQPRRTVNMKGFVIVGSEYVYVEGFTITHDITTYTEGGGVYVGATGARVIDCYIHDIKATAGVLFDPSTPSPGWGYCQVLDNEIIRCNFGIYVFGHDHLIQGNDVSDLRLYSTGDCDYSRFFGENITFRSNRFHDSKRQYVGSAHVDGFQTFGGQGWGSTNCLIERNYVDCFNQGAILQAAGGDTITNIIFKNNVFRRGTLDDTEGGFGINANDVQGLLVYHNTFLESMYGVALRSSTSTGTAKNNIFYNTAVGYAAEPGSVLTGGYNILTPYNPSAYNDPDDLHDVDPRFVNYAKGNYHLDEGSPAINAALDVSVDEDHDGNPRPAGGGYDIGAFEYSPGKALGNVMARFMDWATEWSMVDAFKQSRPWVSCGQYTWDDGRTLDLDANGWVKSLLGDQQAGTLMFTVNKIVYGGNTYYTAPSGKYHVLYDGDGTFDYRMGASYNSGESVPGDHVVDFNPANGGFMLRIATTNPANYIRNIRVIMPGGVSDTDPFDWTDTDPVPGGYTAFVDCYATQIFHPCFLEKIRYYKALRFMNWQVTNEADGRGVTTRTWSDRPLTTDAQWTSRGVPLEIMCDLCNRLDIDPWFCMHHTVDDAFVSSFAALAYSELETGRQVYVEYSNEIWNGQYVQAGYCQTLGLSMGLSTNPFQARLFYQSLRSVQIFDLFLAVFVDAGRLVRVLASQAANSWTGLQLLSFQMAHEKTDALSIAPYFGGYLDDSSLETILEGMTVEQLFTDPAIGIDTYGIPQALGWMESNKALADQHNVDMIAYEGGQHLVWARGFSTNDTINQLFDGANRSTQMHDTYLRYLGGWHDRGGGLFCHFNNCQQWSKYGRWGAVEYMYQDRLDAPKYDALLDYMELYEEPPEDPEGEDTITWDIAIRMDGTTAKGESHSDWYKWNLPALPHPNVAGAKLRVTVKEAITDPDIGTWGSAFAVGVDDDVSWTTGSSISTMQAIAATMSDQEGYKNHNPTPAGTVWDLDITEPIRAIYAANNYGACQATIRVCFNLIKNGDTGCTGYSSPAADDFLKSDITGDKDFMGIKYHAQAASSDDDKLKIIIVSTPQLSPGFNKGFNKGLGHGVIKGYN
jgi:hypothetical protein